MKIKNKSLFLLPLIILVSITSCSTNNDTINKSNLKKDKPHNIINLSNYDYPLPEDSNSDEYTVAVISTNDVHGSAFPKEAFHPVTKHSFTFGGLEYLSNQIHSVHKQWGDRLIWLDGGDQFQGGLENTLTDGEIITYFYNKAGLNGTALGNHEFDFGQEFLNKRQTGSTYSWHMSNVVDDNNVAGFTPNSYEYKIYQAGDIKIGIIGLSTVDTPRTTGGDLTNFNFLEYIPVIKRLSPKLKSLGADLVLLNTHIGMACSFKDINELKVRDKFSDTEKVEDVCSKADEMYQILEEIDSSLIDGVIGGHRHTHGHYWINNIPFVSNTSDGKAFHIAYFTFKKNKNNSKNDTKKYTYLPDKTKIEGPVPVCEKIFTETKQCEINNFTTNPGHYWNYIFHNQYIKKDKNLTKKFAEWYELLKPYKEVLAKTELLLNKSYSKDSVLTNYLSDCTCRETNTDFSILNPGLFRTNWLPGNIDEYALMNMFPFGNNVVKFNISGADIKKLLNTIQEGQFGLYALSGIKTYIEGSKKSGEKKVTKLTLKDDSEILDEKMYTMSSLDFLVEGYGDDFKYVKDWFKPKFEKIGKESEVFKKCLIKDKIITKDTSMEYQRLHVHVLDEDSNSNSNSNNSDNEEDVMINKYMK